MVKLTVIEQNYLFQSETDPTDFVALQINDTTVNDLFSADLSAWYEQSKTIKQTREFVASFIEQFMVC